MGGRGLVAAAVVAAFLVFAAAAASETAPSYSFSVGGFGTANGLFHYPPGVAVDPVDGSVYVADYGNDRVQKLSAVGTFIWKYDLPSGSKPQAITVAPNRHVFVASGAVVGGYLKVYEFDGSANPPVGTLNYTTGSGNGDLGANFGPHGIAVDADGFIYIGDTDNDRIQKFSSVVSVARWTASGVRGIAISPTKPQYVYAAESNHANGDTTVQKFSTAGVLQTSFGTQTSTGNGGFNYPFGIAVDPYGFVYVSDQGTTVSANKRVQKFDAAGTFLSTFGNGQVTSAFGVAPDAGGRVYVADNSSASTVLAFDPSGYQPETRIAITSSRGADNNRTSTNPTSDALDDNLGTFTWTTESGNGPQLSWLEFGFSSTPLDKIRWYAQDNYGARNMTIQYATGTNSDLHARTWTTVTNLGNGFNGEELLNATAVSSNGTVTGDASDHQWTQLTFDTVVATGVRIAFTTPGQPNNHFQVAEFQAYGPDLGPTPAIALSPSSPDGDNSWYVSDVTPTVTLSDGDATGVSGTRCQLDPSSTPSSYSDLAGGCTYTGGTAVGSDGQHVLYAAGIDTRGTKGTLLSSEFNIDKTNPTAQIDNGPLNPSKLTGATFAFTTGDGQSGLAKVDCKLDTGSYDLCQSSTAQVYATLAYKGSHIFTIRSTDFAGRTSTDSRSWTNGTAPKMTLAKVAKLINDNSPTFTWTTSDPGATYTCTLNNADAPCTTFQSQSYAGPLGDGLYTFRVSATDAANRAAKPVSATFTIDTTPPPDPQFTLTPPDPSASTAANFAFTEAEKGAKLTCALDMLAPKACAGKVGYKNLTHAMHTFTVTATDPAGNTSQAQYSWTIS